MKYTILTNASGTRHLDVTDDELTTIERHALFRHLIDSNGVIDEEVLERLKLNLRSLIASSDGDAKDLLALAYNVVFHDNMKAYGLQQLVRLYLRWLSADGAPSSGPAATPEQP
jgi:hypothetical protein